MKMYKSSLNVNKKNNKKYIANAVKLSIKPCKSKAPNSQSKRKGCFIFLHNQYLI